MKTMTLAAIGVTFFASHTALAGEITGGSVGLSYSAFTEDTSVARLGLEGSIEIAFNQNFSMQADLGYHDGRATDLDSTTYGLHAIYHLNQQSSVGAFYTIDDTDIGSADVFGFEVGHETGQFELEGYLARVDSQLLDANLFGIAARYEFSNQLGLTGSLDRGKQNGEELTRIGVKLDRDMPNNINLFVEFGSAKVDIAGVGSGSEPFVGLGGKIAFGKQRGATFEQRSLSRLLPGL